MGPLTKNIGILGMKVDGVEELNCKVFYFAKYSFMASHPCDLWELRIGSLPLMFKLHRTCLRGLA